MFVVVYASFPFNSFTLCALGERVARPGQFRFDWYSCALFWWNLRFISLPTHTHTHWRTRTLAISLNTLTPNALFRYVYIYLFTYTFVLLFLVSSYVFTKINGMESSLGQATRQTQSWKWSKLVFTWFLFGKRFSLKIFLVYLLSAKVRHCPLMGLYICMCVCVQCKATIYGAAYGNSFTLTYLRRVYVFHFIVYICAMSRILCNLLWSLCVCIDLCT